MTSLPTYILAPSFRFKPKSGPIALGNIIADPLRPHRALTTVDAATLESTYPRIETFHERERQISHSKTHDISLAIWAQFLQTVCAKVSGGRADNLESVYTMEDLETLYFVDDPSLEEIQARISSARVQSIMKPGRVSFTRHPVYMVTGMMIAKGFKAQTHRGKGSSTTTEATGTVPTPIGDIGIGASAGRANSTQDSQSWVTSEDIVFAYQLLKIELKGLTGDRVVYDEHKNKAGFLFDGDSHESGQRQERQGQENQDQTSGLTVAQVDHINVGASDPGQDFAIIECGTGDSAVQCIYALDT